MEYELIATLGPTSNNHDIWTEMAAVGVTGFRLNTSHLSRDQMNIWLESLDRFLSSIEPQPALVLDLQGSKWRLGNFSPFTLEAGQPLELVCAPEVTRPGVLPVPHPDFFTAAYQSNGEILIDDAKIQLALQEANPNRLSARVIRGGEFYPKKGITFASYTYRIETMNEKDRTILEMTRGFPSIRYALSYVKDAVEMARYRDFAGHSVYLIAKLERREALEEAAQIATISNELWLCRGDLGAELGLRSMAEAVYRLINRLRDLSAPVLLAGQVLEHMTYHTTPTRSEVCYLYDALARGIHGFVLSDETAIGQNPVESCRVAAMFRKA